MEQTKDKQIENLLRQIGARMSIARTEAARCEGADAARWEGRILAYLEVVKLIEDLQVGEK